MTNVEKICKIVGEDWIITRREQMEGYLVDETALAVRPKPADNVVVVKPANSKEISEILKLANSRKKAYGNCSLQYSLVLRIVGK